MAAGDRYLILSDMHFGTSESQINEQAPRDGLMAYMVDNAPWKEIVFTGDLLDVNLSTFRLALEGGQHQDEAKPLFGFQQLLAELDQRMKAQSGAGLEDLADRWVYTPGNHDYKVWDILSTHVAFEDVLVRGAALSSFPGPLQAGSWSGLESFFGGLFRSFGIEERVLVEYPDHIIDLAGKGESTPASRLLLTHGHYLDKSQTLWNDIGERLGESVDVSELPKRRRALFIKTAQYQAVANAVSYTLRMRQVVSGAVGPQGLGSKLWRVVHWLSSLPLRLFFGAERRRGERLDYAQLRRIEVYVARFRGHSEPPRWFVFGHTHRQGEGITPKLRIRAINSGSCYPDEGAMITFAVIVSGENAAPLVHLRRVDGQGTVS